MTAAPTGTARQDTPAGRVARPAVRIRHVAGVAVYDVHHGLRRITWPSWQIAMSHANRLATVDTLRRRAS